MARHGPYLLHLDHNFVVLLCVESEHLVTVEANLRALGVVSVAVGAHKLHVIVKGAPVGVLSHLAKHRLETH